MKHRVLAIIFLLLLATACGPASEATTPSTPTPTLAATEPATSMPTVALAATEPAAPTPTAVPVTTEPPTPTAAVEAVSASATPVPTEPPPPTATTAPAATPTSSPTSAPQGGGSAGFRDSLAVADQFVLNLTNVPAPPNGQAYQGWLVGDDGTTTSTGLLNLNPDGSASLEWNSPNSENLLGGYARFQVTLEPAAGSPSPAGQVVFAGGLEGQALANARRLFVRNDGEPATPLDTAFTIGLRAQADIAAQHVQNAVNAAAIGALPEMQLHLEHVINALEGQGGPRFGDYTGDGRPENPGDGFGVIGYSSQIAQLLSDQPSVATHAADVQAQSAAIQDKSLEILGIQDMAAASARLGELSAMASQLKAGPVAGLYRAAQDAISFRVSAAP